MLTPGHFRTEILSTKNCVYGDRNIPDYKAANEMCQNAVNSLHMNQPGDPKIAAIRIVDAVKSEGEANGKDLPSVLPMGEDALAAIRKRCKDMMAICDEWETFAKTTTNSGTTIQA